MTFIAWSSENELRAFPRIFRNDGCGLYFEPPDKDAGVTFTLDVYPEPFKRRASGEA